MMPLPGQTKQQLSQLVWKDVYMLLNITPEDERLYRMLNQRREVILCTLSEASDLIEFEREQEMHDLHCRAMKQAVDWGEAGHIPDSYDIRKLHQMLFPHGGQWRTCDVRIKDSSLMPPRAEFVPIAIHSYVEDSRWWLTNSYEKSILKKLAHLHLQFELIHCFQDGNGRVGRMLLNSHASYLGAPFIRLDFEHRDVYLDALELQDEDELARIFKECFIR